jgi:hypothetical protein
VDVSYRTLLVPAGLLIVVCGAASSQPQPTPTTPPPPPVVAGVQPPPPVYVKPVTPTPPSLVIPAVPQEKSVDELLNDLEQLQAQKAELEKRERELKATLRKRLEKQAERLNKLGVAPQPAKEPEPDRVGRIVIEGNTKTPDKKILEKLELFPGQILQQPALEAARARLEKAGFRGVKVEVISNEVETHFKDIRVTVDESDR